MGEIHSAPDRDLVEAVLARRQGAFEQLVGRYQRLCWHVIQRMVRDPEAARELCQDTFLRVYQSLHQYRHDSPLKSWIGRVAYNVALRHLEQRQVPIVNPGDDADHRAMLENIADGADVELACTEAEASRLLHAALDALPPVQRTLLALYHLEEIPIPEIARITGMPAGTIKSHLFRSRLSLRGVLDALKGVAR
jgi:RNA polymerase sigma factor (sigma-70 family)